MTNSLNADLTKKRDFTLIKNILKGSQSDFAELMSLYKNRIFIFGKSFFHNDEDANDFVQDVFIKVYTHLKDFKYKSQFSTWLMRIAWTTAINSKERKKEYLPISDDFEIISNELSPEEKQIRQLTKDAINEAVRELPEKYAVCVDMYFYYDIPYSEISEITDIPVNTIKSHIFRSKKILKEKLEALNAE